VANTNGHQTPRSYSLARSKEFTKKTMPICFQESFRKKVAVIIDCFEVFIDRPSNLKARASMWSNYKHRNAAEVLIGITPQGRYLEVLFKVPTLNNFCVRH